MSTAYLTEIRNRYGLSLASRVDRHADDALATVIEYVSAIGLDPMDSGANGHVSDAVYSAGPVGSAPEVWTAPNGTQVVMQIVRLD